MANATLNKLDQASTNFGHETNFGGVFSTNWIGEWSIAIGRAEGGTIVPDSAIINDS
jgi:hypothetical protein